MDDKYREIAILKTLGDQDTRMQLPHNKGFIVTYDDFYSSDALGIRDRIIQIEYLKENDLYWGDPEWLTYDIINCFGGSLEGALAGYDFLREFLDRSGMKLRVRVFGACYSAAAMILLQAGDERVCSPHSNFLLHEPRQFTMNTEKVSDLVDRSENIKRLSEVVYTIMAKRSGRSIEEVTEEIERRELWLSPEDMIKRNLLDGILTYDS